MSERDRARHRAHGRTNASPPPPRRRTQGQWEPFAFGALAKIFASTLTYPYQLVKARIQQRQVGLVRYDGVIDAASKIWRGEGAAGFFKGIVPNWLKVAPSAAITFWVYENVYATIKDM